MRDRLDDLIQNTSEAIDYWARYWARSENRFNEGWADGSISAYMKVHHELLALRRDLEDE